VGKVYLVGAGPGDPDLLTVKAARILRQADVVIYDRLVSAEVLAMANPDAKFIFAGKQMGEQERIQTRIHELLLENAPLFNCVVRLKGGDPMVFGRGAEEWAHVAAAGIDVEIVPGISSAISVPALAGIPLTCRGVAASFAVIAGHRQSVAQENWSQYTAVDTLVILMGVENRKEIAKHLIRAGRSIEEPVAFIERGSTDRERIVITKLREVARGTVAVESPAVMVIGQVVRLRRILHSRNTTTQQEPSHVSRTTAA
jgi:uroporphyrin-III C-methyltransferase